MAVGQFEVVSKAAPTPGQSVGRVAFFDENGDPVDIGGGGGSVAWGDVTGKPSTFAPATHTHDIGDVTGLQALISDLTDRVEALEQAAG